MSKRIFTLHYYCVVYRSVDITWVKYDVLHIVYSVHLMVKNNYWKWKTAVEVTVHSGTCSIISLYVPRWFCCVWLDTTTHVFRSACCLVIPCWYSSGHICWLWRETMWHDKHQQNEHHQRTCVISGNVLYATKTFLWHNQYVHVVGSKVFFFKPNLSLINLIFDSNVRSLD